MIPKKRKRERFGTRETTQVRCPGHLQFVRLHECSISGHLHACFGRIEAAHCRLGTDGGMGVKPSDTWTIPLCTGAHAEQHRIGEAAFERKYGIDMKKIATDLARTSPHRMKWMKP